MFPPQREETSRALIDETRDAIQQARLHDSAAADAHERAMKLDAATRPPDRWRTRMTLNEHYPRQLVRRIRRDRVVRHPTGHNFEGPRRGTPTDCITLRTGKPSPRAVDHAASLGASADPAAPPRPSAARSALLTVLATNRSDGYNWPVAGRSRPPATVQDRDGAEALLREARRSFPFIDAYDQAWPSPRTWDDREVPAPGGGTAASASATIRQHRL